MKRSFASMLPAREARQAYKKLQQTGSVKQFVREQIQIRRELEGTPFHPGGSVFDDFIDGLKPDVKAFVLTMLLQAGGQTSRSFTRKLWILR